MMTVLKEHRQAHQQNGQAKREWGYPSYLFNDERRTMHD